MSSERNDPDAADLAIGQHVRLLRVARGWSLRDASARARALGIRGLSARIICDLENGKVSWSTSYAARVGDMLGVPTSVVYAGALDRMAPRVDREAA